MLADQVSQTKLIASLVLFVITLLCGYLPVKMILNQNYIQHAMFAGGGVLMATAFCHLIPEAHDSYKLLSPSSSHAHAHHHHHPHQHQHLHDQSASASPSQAEPAALQYLNVNSTLRQLNETLAATTTTTTASTTMGGELNSFMARINGLNVPYLEVTLCFGFFFMYLCEQLMLKFINSHTHEHPCDTSTGQLIVGQSPTLQRQQQDQHQHQHQHQQQRHQAGIGVGGDGLAGQTVGPGPGSNAGSASEGNLSASIMGSSSGRNSGASELYKCIRGFLIVSAFGMHSIFDGVAIGSQETVEKVWTIFGAISCHKLIIAAVVGLELFAATLESHLWTLVHLTIFSIMSPIGIILVVVAQNSLNINSNHPSMILLQSFATGTLLYIIFVEILQPKEGHLHSKNRIWKSLSLILGFGLMLTVLTLIDH